MPEAINKTIRFYPFGEKNTKIAENNTVLAILVNLENQNFLFFSIIVSKRKIELLDFPLSTCFRFMS